MSLQIYKRSNPDDLKQELTKENYLNLHKCIETSCNDKRLEKQADRYLEIYDWDLKKGINRLYIDKLRHRDQEVDLPDASKFGEEEYLIIISYLKNEWDRQASLLEEGETNAKWSGENKLNGLIRRVLSEVNTNFYMEVE